MYFYTGSHAFTEFRHQTLFAKLKAIFPELTTLTATSVYLVQGELTQNQASAILSLLPNATLTECEFSDAIWVFPRLGTQSPWSSKATDIAKACGHSNVERIEQGICYTTNIPTDELLRLGMLLHDPLTESILSDQQSLASIFDHAEPAPLNYIPLLANGKAALVEADQAFGLALSSIEIDYLLEAYQSLHRDPTDVELMMFAQVNSEHCRHKIFNAEWTINNKDMPNSLFGMIKNTYQQHPENVILAYRDNAAILKGSLAERLIINPKTNIYETVKESAHIVFKVETHNHPTAISPFPGAATGSGGEIRDEAATGCGASPKMGLAGFSVSHLEIPGCHQPWEIPMKRPAHMASAFQIMIEAPIGAASFNNEFGRPNCCGYFRTFGVNYQHTHRAYHKPIMLAGGVGNIRPAATEKHSLPVGAKLIVLGGPAMPIGLGGGAASSRATSDEQTDLDFASVQRSNPEMERRCQEVINTCVNLGEENPILSIHDVGAGGLSNALPELVEACDHGAEIDIRKIPNAAPGMSPLEIWCNEAQERFVLAILPEHVETFTKIAERERCLFAIVGEVTEKEQCRVTDPIFKKDPVDLPMDVLFKSLPKIHMTGEERDHEVTPFSTDGIVLSEAIHRVLQFPCVADKKFLITIGDRSVTGLVTRDQLVGPWQVAVSDVAVTASDYQGYTGEAMSMGERAPVALIDAAASARMAVGEALTNIVAADIDTIRDISLSANWMAAPQSDEEAAALYRAVEAIGLSLCPELGICIPVGKDSLSMRTQWQIDGEDQAVVSPLSLVITAAGKVNDVRQTLTPELNTKTQDSLLIFIDLGCGHHALGASALAQVYQTMEGETVDLRSPTVIQQFFKVMHRLRSEDYILAYHDRSDGGLMATITEMMFAGRAGVDLDLDRGNLNGSLFENLFNEELGAVIQIPKTCLSAVQAIFEDHEMSEYCHPIGALNQADSLRIIHNGQTIFEESRSTLHRSWSKTSYHMQKFRDHPECAQQEYDVLLETEDPGLSVSLTFDINDDISAPYINTGIKPSVAILREQGVNGHVEMAAAFDRAGFTAVDVHMTDLMNGKSLESFSGLVACGGFSYGDVLGAGRGWAKTIASHQAVSKSFQAFFERDNTFTLGVCNGCQMLSQIKHMIPGADHWPSFVRNFSEQFEARLSLVKVADSSSIFFKGMAGSVLPITVAHGEGRVVFSKPEDSASASLALSYVDHHYHLTDQYPANPNGSDRGMTGFTSSDGRALIMMPHPERVFRTVQMSWHPDTWGEDSPWLRFFRNARMFVN